MAAFFQAGVSGEWSVVGKSTSECT